MSTRVDYYVIDLDDYIGDAVANREPDDSVYFLEQNYREIGDFLVKILTDLPKYRYEQHWIVSGGSWNGSCEAEVYGLLTGFSDDFYDNLARYIKDAYNIGDAEEELLDMIKELRG